MFASSMGDWVRTFASNIEKVEKRKQATRVMIGGGVFLVGGVILISMSKKNSRQSNIRQGNQGYY